jgi:hypothetical protein
MKYVPSPIPLHFAMIFTATANRSGRMQYHKVRAGHTKLRITRGEFIRAYNDSEILAVRPLQAQGVDSVFQLEFYI